MPDPQPLSADDFQWLYETSLKSDPASVAQAVKVTKTLTPDESKAYRVYLQSAGKIPSTTSTTVGGVPVTVASDPARADSNIAGTASGAGVAPEDALMVGMAVKNTVGAVRGGTGIIGKALAGVKQVAEQAGPAVKYELARTALMSAGIPGPAATAAAMLFSGYRAGAKSPSTAPEAPPAAAVDLAPSAQAAQAARAQAFQTPAAPPEAPAAPQAQTPTPAPVASPAPAQPAARDIPVVNRTATPADYASDIAHMRARGQTPSPQIEALARGEPVAPMSTPDAFRSALKAFADAKEVPRPAEVNNVQQLIKRGVAPDKALQTVLGNRPPAPANPAAELAKRLGTPSEAEMNADMAARARKGQKSLMPKYGGDVDQTAETSTPITASASASESAKKSASSTSKPRATKEWWVRGPGDTIIRFDRTMNRFTVDGVSNSFYSRAAAEEYVSSLDKQSLNQIPKVGANNR
jgi:hypothetical protein